MHVHISFDHQVASHLHKHACTDCQVTQVLTTTKVRCKLLHIEIVNLARTQ